MTTFTITTSVRLWLGPALAIALVTGCAPAPTASWVTAKRPSATRAVQAPASVLTVRPPEAFRGTGAVALAFRFPQAAYTVQQVAASRVERLRVRLKTRAFLLLKQVAQAEVSRDQAQDGRAEVAFESLQAGEYVLSAEAIGAGGMTLGTAEQAVTVVDGETREVQTRLALAPAAPAPAPALKGGGLAVEIVIEDAAPAPAAPAWQAARAYRKGDVVSHGGARWEATTDGVTWAPAADGSLGSPVGFGRRATGGTEPYWVTTLADDGPGSLRAGLESAKPHWVRFKVSGTITLTSSVRVASNKTVDGRGADVTIARHGLQLSGVENVIVSHLTFRGDRAVDDDAVRINKRTRHVWVNHCDMSNYQDGLIDVTEGATDVTVSWTRLHDHDKVMLLGADDTHTVDKDLRVTLHHNYFDRGKQRHPRLRFGKVHLVNNYFREWQVSNVAVYMGGQVLSQANVYEPQATRKKVGLAVNDDLSCARSLDDLALDGAQIQEHRPSQVFGPTQFYPLSAEKADLALRARIQAFAGPGLAGAGWKRL